VRGAETGRGKGIERTTLKEGKGGGRSLDNYYWIYIERRGKVK